MAIYFLQAENEGLVKIGFSKNLHARFRQLQNYSPVPLSVLRVIEDGTKRGETLVLLHFASLRSYGDWFAYHPTMLTVLPSAAISPIGRVPRHKKFSCVIGCPFCSGKPLSFSSAKRKTA